ncbi:hypothetical protein M885DRAFT_503820 [Pelagophyceae sp. CCMP2097]|nr:hypothetical protein M885DRAFT_503820 [Pelagophyceae sp. CCMP2097]
MDGATVRGRQIAVELASDTAPARKPPTTQPRSGGKAAAIVLNKRLISSVTAGDVLSLFETEGGNFNYVNFATSLHRLGILSRSLEKSSRPLLQELVDRATSSIINESNEWEARGLANACWGTAKIGNVEAPALFEAIAAEAPKKIATFNPQELANTVWAYATAGVEAPALFEAIAAEAPKKIATFNPQDLANTVWAYATAGVEAPALFEAIAAEAPKKMATFNPQNLANTVWAYATAGVEAPALFEAIATEAPKKIATFKPQNLANTVWAYATAGVEAPALFVAIAAEAQKKIAMFTPQALANTVWAYATAGAPALFELIAFRIEAKISEFSPENLSQLHKVYVHLRLESPQHALTLVLSRHEAALRAAHLREEPTPSQSQRDVSAALSRIGWAHDFEHVTAEGISLDMAHPASKFAVEFDGPTHYLAGASGDVSTRALDGKSKSKEQLLRGLGWKLVRVPYFEWMKLRSSAEREAYLRGKIKT